MNTGDYKAVTAGVKGGERLVLTLIAMYAEEGQKVSSRTLTDDTGLSVKQIVRLTEKLKESGRVQIEGGVGRAPYVYSLASANQDKMSAQVSQDIKGAQDIKSPQEIRSADIMSPLADARTKSPDYENGSADKKSGTPIAPYSDIRTSTDNTSHTHTARARKLPDLSPERQAEVAELHAYYCGRIEPAPLDAKNSGTLNRAIGEKGIAYCKKVIDGCALDDWPDRKFNNSIQFIFRDAERMGRLEKIARVKADETGKGSGRSQHGGGRNDARRNGGGKASPPPRQWAVKARVGG